MKDRDREVVIKMIKYCNDVNLLMEKYKFDFELYKSDISFQYSCNMCIIQIGELVGRLSDEFIELNSQFIVEIKFMTMIFYKLGLIDCWGVITNKSKNIINI